MATSIGPTVLDKSGSGLALSSLVSAGARPAGSAGLPALHHAPRHRAAGVASVAGAGPRAPRQAAPDVPGGYGLGGLSPHSFEIAGSMFGTQVDEFPDEELDERR